MAELPKNIKEKIRQAQRDEITEYYIYSQLAEIVDNQKNSEILSEIAEDELKHYNFWVKKTGQHVKANRFKVFIFVWIARILGITFGLKLLEQGEEEAQTTYQEVTEYIPEAHQIIDDEDDHETELLNLIDEDRLQYIGSIVLGLNDALVELTGTLAGLTFALQDTVLIALAGTITGISASFSMAASEYLSEKSEGNGDTALTASLYTGLAYIVTVVALIAPFLIVSNYLLALISTLVIGVLIIFFFNYYISVAKDYSFKKRFIEMAVLSLGVAFISFIIGYLIRVTLGVEI
ncbi:MAG: VIT1/CCC1 transporter family protein [Bacillota bacterium]